MNIPHFHFILFNLKIFGKIVTPIFLLINIVYFVQKNFLNFAMNSVT